LVVHHYRGPRVPDRRRGLDGAVRHDERRIGVPSAHHPAVTAEKLDAAAFGDRGSGDDARGKLDALATDAGQQKLSLHGSPFENDDVIL
jgi:hypothetical protein